jgi:hypothetical protein
MNLRSNGPSDYRAVTVYPLQYGIPGCNPGPKANTTPLYNSVNVDEFIFVCNIDDRNMINKLVFHLKRCR